MNVLKKYLILLIVLSLLVAVSCTKQPIKGTESSISETGEIKKIKIVVDQANIRSGCSDDTSVIHTTTKNNKFDVVSQVADWYAVKLPNNQIGFIPQKDCTPIVPDDTKKDIAPQNQTTPGTTTNDTTNNQTTPGTTTGTTTNAGSNTKQTTPDNTQTNNNTLTAQEQEMLKLVNEARAQNNVPALQIDMELTNVARIKAQDMIDNNYFSHNSPKYGSPFDMMKSFGISYVQAGENIAGNQNVQKAHEALMNSPGHRKNILNPDYTHIGIGIRSGGQYGNMFCQMFISKPQ